MAWLSTQSAGLATGDTVALSRDPAAVRQVWSYQIITPGAFFVDDLIDLEGQPLPTLLPGSSITPVVSWFVISAACNFMMNGVGFLSCPARCIDTVLVSNPLAWCWHLSGRR